MKQKSFYDVAEVAKIVGRSTEATRKWLRRLGVARKVGGRWFVTRSQLIGLYPEVFQKLAQ